MRCFLNYLQISNLAETLGVFAPIWMLLKVGPKSMEPTQISTKGLILSWLLFFASKSKTQLAPTLKISTTCLTSYTSTFTLCKGLLTSATPNLSAKDQLWLMMFNTHNSNWIVTVTETRTTLLCLTELLFRIKCICLLFNNMVF